MAYFRYRQQLGPANLTIPLVISEFGIDNSPCGGSPNFGGWHKYCAWWASTYGIGNSLDDCAAYYVDQISWYDRMIREDDYVIGATIYSLEIAGNWAPYDVAAAVPQLTRRVQSIATLCDASRPHKDCREDAMLN